MCSVKTVMSYTPSDSDFKHMIHCTKLGLIKLGIHRATDMKDEYYISRYDDSVIPPQTHYFLKNFKLPPTPSNKEIFTEYEAYKKIFEIYKEFYLRNTNVPEDEIK